MLIRSTLSPGSYKTSPDPPPKSLSLHCRQINKVKNELDGQPSSLLASMHVSSYKPTFSPIYLVFLELETDWPHLDFKMLDEKNSEVISRMFYLQLLNKQMSIYYIIQWQWGYWLIHHARNIVSYTLKFMAQLPLAAVRSNLHKNISFYYQRSP